MPRGRPKGAKNRKTSARERAEKIAAARAELAKHAPPIDFTAVYDSLDIMERVMRRFYLRGLVEESMGTETGAAAMQQVAEWLEKLGLRQYAERFAENGISFAVLPDLTDQDP